MDLTPTTSTTKRVRSKSPASVPKEKAAAATKTIRTRKKPGSSDGSMPVSSGVAVSSEQLTVMIATAAYYIAAERNFAPGNEIDDWLMAERQVLNSL